MLSTDVSQGQMSADRMEVRRLYDRQGLIVLVMRVHEFMGCGSIVRHVSGKDGVDALENSNRFITVIARDVQTRRQTESR